MNKYTKKELQNILELHLKWLNNEKDGVRVDLNGSNLSGSDLRGSDLRYSDLRGSDLRYSDLSGSTGINYACCSFDSHGECGRQLLAVNIEGKVIYFCGCFSGSEKDLKEYIEKGKKQDYESRMLTFKFVSEAIKMKRV